jgi:hypothetical protein
VERVGKELHKSFRNVVFRRRRLGAAGFISASVASFAVVNGGRRNAPAKRSVMIDISAGCTPPLQ